MSRYSRIEKDKIKENFLNDLFWTLYYSYVQPAYIHTFEFLDVQTWGKREK